MARDPTQLIGPHWSWQLYDDLRKWLLFTAAAVVPTTFILNAPFGRFAPDASRPASLSPIGFFNMPAFQLDGIRSWIFMELVSPLTFIYAYLISPLSFFAPPLPAPVSPQAIMCCLFFVHYLNRALISPLRTPSRSKSHVIVVLVGVAFNLANGFLLGSYFSSPLARIYLGGTYGFQRPSFWIGIALWLAGFIGNVAHDEILFDMRRKAKERKEKAGEEREGSEKKTKKDSGEHYGIPTGLLYKYISYPNYFCEWVEWFGFALAASPPLFEDVEGAISILSPLNWAQAIRTPSRVFAPMLTPPWIFFIAEILMMLPRAYRGHQWYKQRFGERYPKDRKAVIPFVIWYVSA